MQEELLKFHLQKVWTLVDLPRGKWAIGTKWVFRNKKDERGIVIKNKARLVAQGCTQEEGIDYDEVFVPMARIKAIKLFLAYASFMGFLVYQMDVKSAFLYGRIEEEKALYGLHQAPRAWYETLAKYLLEYGFCRGKIDQTLFIKRQKEDILLIQVYINDIIFRSTKKELCIEFKDKYVDEILRKFKYEDVKPANTPMDIEKPLLKDLDGDDVDVHLYRLTFAGDAHHIWLSLILDKKMIKYELSNGLTLDNGEIKLNAIVDSQVKTIIKASVRRHLKLADADGISTLPITKFFEQLALMGTLDSTPLIRDYIAPSLTQKVFSNMKRESWGFSGVETTLFSTMLFTEYVSHGEGAADEAITKEMHDGLGRAITTASSLTAEHGSGNIYKTQTKATLSGPSSLRSSSEGGHGYHFTMGDSPVQARPERLSNLPNELPLGEDKVTHLENELTSTKAVYNNALITLTKRVKKLEKKLKHKCRREVIDSLEEEEASLDHVDSPKQGRMIKEIDKDENVNLVKSSEQGEAHEIAEHILDLSTASQTDDDETLAKTLLNIKRSAAKDKEKAIMQESEFVPMKSKGQSREESSKEGKSLKRSVKEELGHEQKVEEEIAQQEDVVAKQAKKESSKKVGGRLKRKYFKC
nr:hypothetical protein [Tanacetum cinerariifolium]